MTTIKPEDLAAEQQELVEEMNAELKASVADEFRALEDNTITKASLEAEPEKTARNFIRLYGDFRKLQAQASALKAERGAIVSKAAKADVLQRRLEAMEVNTAGIWCPIPSLDEGKLLCTAAPLNGLNRVGTVLLKFTDGKLLYTTELRNASVAPMQDGGYTLTAR